MPELENAGRVRFLVRITLIWAVLIFGKLVSLQIVHHEEFVKQARQQQRKQIEIQGPRGTIFDRSGLALAKSLPVDSVCVNPLRVPDVAVAAQLLSPVLGLDPAEVYSDIQSAAEKKRGFLWIKRRITPHESERLRSLNLNWVEFRQESRRFYPNGKLASHVIGGVDFQEKGNAGIELSQEEHLAGRVGEVRMFTDSRHNAYQTEFDTEPLPGKDLYLTIDSRIQNVAERALAEAAGHAHARSGSLVAVDPRTGDILALANYPDFDPNEPVPNDPAQAGKRNNLALTSPYEPGSVFKVVTLSAALEHTRLKPTDVFSCGALKIGNHTYKESHAGYYGSLSMADILAKSSNLGAIQIGFRVGAENMYDIIRKLGFGKVTGIGLPSESPGLVRNVNRWSKTSLASISMGHEVLVTATQLAQLGAIIANGGMSTKLRLITRRQRPGESPETVEVPKPVRVLSPRTVVAMRNMLEGVVLKGTARGRANLKGYTSGGKTGTAQIYDRKAHAYTHFYNGSFLGLAPVKNPAIVIVVTLNGTTGGGGYGGQVAAPVFREVATAALRLLDVPKDLVEDDQPDTGIEPSSDDDDLAIAGLDPQAGFELSSDPQLVQGPALDQPFLTATAAGGPRVPDFRGKTMRDVVEEAGAMGLKVELLGSGIARTQLPPPGATLPRGERVRVQFGR